MKKKTPIWLEVVGDVAIPLVGTALVVQQIITAGIDRQQAVMSQYLDQMTSLLTEGDLNEDEPHPRTKNTAQAVTFNALRQLNSERKGQLLRFLYDSRLIGGCRSFDPKTLDPLECNSEAIVDLKTAKFDRAKSDDPNRSLLLRGAILSQAVLNGADLQETSMDKAVMEGAQLVGANLNGATLREANLRGATLIDANFQGADLRGAKLDGATLLTRNLTDNAKYNGDHFKNALFDKNTTFPTEKFDPIALGMQSCDLEEIKKPAECKL